LTGVTLLPRRDPLSQRLAAFIIDESKWMTISMGVALLAVAILLNRHRVQPARTKLSAAMSLLFGVTVGIMGFGHLLAVTVKLALGTMSVYKWTFYPIGLALAVPAGWLILHSIKGAAPANEDYDRRTLILNAWLAVTLLALGPHNLPLAIPGLLAIAYHMHSRPIVGWAIVALAVAVTAGLFIGSLIFLASGQSFEQFKGMR
jgi:bacteriorhodopsin